MQQQRGFIVVKPKSSDDPTPLFCPVCAFPNLTQDDIYAFKEHKCCSACVMRWVDIHREKWATGWRPEPEDIKRETLRRRARPLKLPF